MLRLSVVWGCKLCSVQKVNELIGVKYGSVYCRRALSDVKHVQNSQPATEVSNKEYHMFYRFPHVRLFGTLNTLKKYTTVLAVAGVPSCFLLSSLNFIEHDFLSTFFGVGLLVNVLLYSLGTLSNKVIGALYLSSDGTTVKISHLNFWGRRVDIYCPVDDVVPISEVQEHFVLPYIKFKQYSTSRSLLLPLHFGKVLNQHMFTEVFGSM